jgi:fibronectin type 3 domain-containing protein
MKKAKTFIGQVPETFSQKKRIPRLPLIVVALLIGVVGTYAVIHSLAATTAPFTKIYGVNNAVGWGGITAAHQQLGVNGDRTCQDETNLDSTLTQEAAQGMYFTVCENSDEGFTSLNSHSQDYANLVATQAKTYGPGGTYWASHSQYSQYAVQSFEIMNEPYGWWFRGGDNDPAAYAHIAAAAIRAGHAANPQAKFYISLASSDIKLANGSWVDWNQALLRAEPDLFNIADGFSIHIYDTPPALATTLDKYKNWAWSQTGGNGKPFIITEANLTDQQASPEADYAAAMPQFVKIAQDRSWVKELFIFAWHGYTGRDYLGFLSTSGTPRQARIDAYHNAVQQALAAVPSPPAPPPPPPSDTAVPTVSLTAPSSGATVSDTINLAATASDNVGVAGVQFKLDGTNLGSEDTTSPYSTTWDTTKSSNGSHTITATARDAAANTAIASRTVTVNNVAPDTIPPDTTITAHPNSTTTITDASFSFNSSEANSTFECKLDSGSFTACTSPRVYTSLAVGVHTFSVRATDAAHNQDASPATYAWTVNSPQDTTAPVVSFAAPADNATVSGIVTATANASDSGGIAKVELSLDGTLKVADTASPYNYSFDSKTLSNGNHTLTAKAYDQAGNAATTTVTVKVSNSDTAPPPAPTGLSGTATSPTAIKLTWSASVDSGPNASGVTKYNVLRNGVVVAQPTGTSYTDTTATANTAYSYTVQAVDGAGNVSASSNTTTVTTPPAPDSTPPTTPTGLTATATSASQVNLTWKASTDSGGSGIAGYNVYRGSTKLNSTPITATSYGDGTVTAGSTYSYTVEAVDGAGNKSAQSSAATATTPAAPDTTDPSTPTNLQAKAVSVSEVDLNWNASTDSGGSGLAGYNIYRDRIKINQDIVTDTSYKDTAVRSRTSYRYRVEAVDNAGNKSDKSGSESVTTPRSHRGSSSSSSSTSSSTGSTTSSQGSTGTSTPTSSVTITVVSRRNHPASGATVTIGSQTARTNSHGVAQFAGVPVGTQDVSIQYSDKYVSKSIQVQDSSKHHSSKSQPIKLSLASNQLNPALLLVPVVALVAAAVLIFRPWDRKFAAATTKAEPQVVSSNHPAPNTVQPGRKLETPGAVYSPTDKDHSSK